jgi:NADPH:quinone reductase-like Zn-dependent oxidoreductase
MRAVIVREFGGPAALQVIDVPVPEPGPGQVRIRVAAAAVNPVDAVTRSGLITGLGPGAIGSFEHVGIGWDVAGTVDAAGAGAAGFTAGSRVIGLRDRLDLPTGAYADQIVLDAGDVALAPEGVDLVHAATLPLNGLTALQGLAALDLAAGQTLLVTGAAGGLGGYGVELAALRGLRVVAAANAADEELVRSMGAEFFVPRSAHLATAVRELVPGGVDAAFDAAEIGLAALDAVRGGGAFAAFAGTGPRRLRGIRVEAVHIRADGAALAGLSRLAAAGRISLRVAATYPLAAAVQAHERLDKGGLRGRLVLVP